MDERGNKKVTPWAFSVSRANAPPRQLKMGVSALAPLIRSAAAAVVHCSGGAAKFTHFFLPMSRRNLDVLLSSSTAPSTV